MVVCVVDGEHTVSPVLILHIQLAQTKIAQCDMTSVIKENVLRLQITINDIEPMETFESTQELGGIETCPIDIEPLLFLQVVEQLATIDKCKYEVELFGRLEGELQRNNEGIIDLR